MLFGSVLLAAYAATWCVRGRALTGTDRWRFALAVAMCVAGLMHLVDPTPFLQHLPAWVPARGPLVLATGNIEIALGVAILVPAWRRTAGILLAAYLVAVFPANVYVAVAGIDVQGQPDGIDPYLRLLFQPVFVWLALWSTREHATAIVTRRHAAVNTADVTCPPPATR
jgi:uncharacterized membrane protein